MNWLLVAIVAVPLTLGVLAMWGAVHSMKRETEVAVVVEPEPAKPPPNTNRDEARARWQWHDTIWDSMWKQ